MLIKKIKKKHLNTGKNYFVFQLFEETEIQGVKKFKMILSLGPKLNIPETDHQALADCIESKVRKLPGSKEFTSNIQALAEEYVKQLSQREHARRKRPANVSKKPMNFKKRTSFNEESFDEDYEPKRRFNRFGNKTVNRDEFLRKGPKSTFNKSHSSKRYNSFEDSSFEAGEEKTDFEPKRRFSKFGEKPRGRDDFKPRSQKSSYDRSFSFEKKGSIDKERSEKTDGFEPKRRFSKFGEKSRSRDEFKPRSQKSSYDRSSSFEKKGSFDKDRSEKPEGFEPKRRFSNFGERPRNQEEQPRSSVRRNSNKRGSYDKKSQSDDFKPKKTFSKFSKGPSKNKKSFTRGGPKKRFD